MINSKGEYKTFIAIAGLAHTLNKFEIVEEPSSLYMLLKKYWLKAWKKLY